MRAGRESGLLALIVVLWLVGDAFLGASYLIGIVPTIPGFCALALCVRAATKGRYDALSPWACLALVPLPFLAAIGLGNIHLHEFTGTTGEACDPMAQSCAATPMRGLVHAVAAVAFIAAGVVMLRLIARARRHVEGVADPGS